MNAFLVSYFCGALISTPVIGLTLQHFFTGKVSFGAIPICCLVAIYQFGILRELLGVRELSLEGINCSRTRMIVPGIILGLVMPVLSVAVWDVIRRGIDASGLQNWLVHALPWVIGSTLPPIFAVLGVSRFIRLKCNRLP